MQVTLVFPAKRAIQTVTNLVVDGLDVYGLANSWNNANSVYMDRGPRSTSGDSQVHFSETLEKQATVRARIPACLEGLLVEGDEWMAGGQGTLYASDDRGKTWHPKVKLPVEGPVHSIVRSQGAIWVATPFGFLARQDGDGWQPIELPNVTKTARVAYDASLPYPDLGVSRLKIIGEDLYLLGHGLWKLSNDRARPLTQEIETKKLLVDLARSARGTLIAVGVDGAYHRRAPGEPWKTAPAEEEGEPGYVAIVALENGILLVAKKGKDALSWSTDDGKSFATLQTDAIDKEARLHLAIPDGHGGALVSGFNGLMLRVSTEGGRGPWAKAKATSKKRAGSSEKNAKRAPAMVSAKTKDPRVEAALLADVLAAPDDDAPRLVYADWLTEHGDPRGEFIQIQCLLRRPIYGAKGYVASNERTPPHPEHIELTQREQAIFKKHAKAWLEPIRPFIRNWTWKRGFLGQVTSGPPFLAGASQVLAAHPVAPLVLEGMKVADLEQLAKTPLGGLRMLHLSEQNISAKNARLLAGKNFSNIESLAIGGNRFGDAGVAVLAHESHFHSVKYLSLNACDLEDEGVRALATSPVLANLEELHIGSNIISMAGFEALAASTHLKKLKTVHLGAWVAKDIVSKAVALLEKRYEITTR